MLIKKKRLIVLVTLLSALCMCVASLFVVNTVKASTTPTTASFKMFDGAWFRATGADQTSGMRFAGTISSSEYTALETAYGSKYLEFGVLLCRAEDISSESELEIGSATLTEYDSATGIENGKKYYQRKAVMPQVDETDKNENGDTTEYAFYGSFIGIKEQNFNKNFVAKAYVAFGEDENTRTIEYTNAVSRSIFTVANAGLIGDYAGNAYCQNVYDTVTEGYTNLKIETTVNGSIADPATDSVAMGDKVGVTAKLYDAANQNFIEVQGEYKYTTLTSDNADGTVSVKTLKGLSYEAKVPNFTEQVVTLTPKADQVYTASIDDLNTIFKTTEGESATHSGVDNCPVDKPTFTDDLGDNVPSGATGAEYRLTYNVLRKEDGKFASNYCKGYFDFNTAVYNVGDYITFDLYYVGASSCALHFTESRGGLGGAQLRNVKNAADTMGDDRNGLLAKSMNISSGAQNTTLFSNTWYSFQFEIKAEVPLRFYVSSITQTNESADYYIKNIRISDNSVIDKVKIGQEYMSISAGTGTITPVEQIVGGQKADYKVNLSSGTNFLLNYKNMVAVGDTISFSFYNSSIQLGFVRDSSLGNVVLKPVTDGSWQTTFKQTVSSEDRWQITIYDENGDVVDLNNAGSKYNNQWLTVKAEILSKTIIDMKLYCAYAGSDEARNVYFKDFVCEKSAFTAN